MCLSKLPAVVGYYHDRSGVNESKPAGWKTKTIISKLLKRCAEQGNCRAA